MTTILLIIGAALLPVVVLLIYIYAKDKLRREPISQILKGLLYGVISAIITLVVVVPFGTITTMLAPWMYDTVVGSIFDAFFMAAIPEECAKFFMLWLLTRKNKYFDEHMDGIVYAVAVSMGFAGFENVLYLMDNQDMWINVGLMRAIFSVPGHFFFAVFMGYFYSFAYFRRGFSSIMYGLLAIVVPIGLHGAFDTLLMLSGLSSFALAICTPLFLILCLMLNIYGRRRIKEHLDADRMYIE